jgi:4-amino-4-deoxy-L-arabinose transferase-like glycosyltransferase
MRRSRAYALVVAACAVPRVLVMLHERAGLLANMEKSDLIAQVFVKTGTFGYVPGEPTAYTQPLYGWFLSAVYWVAGRHWWSFSSAQVAVAVATALLVYEVGRRSLSPRVGLLAALIATLQPYLIWHDVHGNREILDQLLGVAMLGLALFARTPLAAAALGAVTGVAILSNTRLVLLPVVFAAYLLWRRRGPVAAVAVPVLAAVVVAPWVVRNKVEVGCFAITTDARALWKANNPNTYETLAHGLWIDQVPDLPQRRGLPVRWMTAQEAGDLYRSSRHLRVHVPECWQEGRYEHLVLQFWEHHPGAKAKLMLQATRMLWDPRVGREDVPTGTGTIRTFVEPAWVIPLYALAIAGLLVVPAELRVLALVFAGYETLGAWVFAGTTRYRVPWDFVLALLAAAAIARLPLPRARPPRPFSQKR